MAFISYYFDNNGYCEYKKRGMALSLLSAYNRSMRSILFCILRSDDMCKLIAGNSMRLFSIFDINRNTQRINIFLSPHRIMLLFQVRIIVRGFDFMISDSGKESTSTDVQSMHGLLCRQQFIIAPCHNKSPLRMFVFYIIDIQHVKSYNMFTVTNNLSHSILLMTLYTKVVASDNLGKGYSLNGAKRQIKKADVSLNMLQQLRHCQAVWSTSQAMPLVELAAYYGFCHVLPGFVNPLYNIWLSCKGGGWRCMYD